MVYGLGFRRRVSVSVGTFSTRLVRRNESSTAKLCVMRGECKEILVESWKEIARKSECMRTSHLALEK